MPEDGFDTVDVVIVDETRNVRAEQISVGVAGRVERAIVDRHEAPVLVELVAPLVD